MRGLKQSSEAELDGMSIQALNLELAFWKQRASQFTRPSIKKLVLKYVYRVEKILQRKEAAQQIDALVRSSHCPPVATYQRKRKAPTDSLRST
jgi:hypothetical protein